MTLKLTKELIDALNAGGINSLEVEDPDSNRTYVVVDAETYHQAIEALHRQQDRDAIAKGLSQMEAGEGIPIAEAREQTRQHLLSRRK